MTGVVADASALVALLVDAGEWGEWVASALRGHDIMAPHLLAFETASVLRRHETADLLSADQAAQAHADLLDLPIEWWPYEPLAARVWELRHNLSAYDAAYIAVAELRGVPLVTLDHRLAAAPGLPCPVATPPS